MCKLACPRTGAPHDSPLQGQLPRDFASISPGKARHCLFHFILFYAYQLLAHVILKFGENRKAELGCTHVVNEVLSVVLGTAVVLDDEGIAVNKDAPHCDSIHAEVLQKVVVWNLPPEGTAPAPLSLLVESSVEADCLSNRPIPWCVCGESNLLFHRSVDCNLQVQTGVSIPFRLLVTTPCRTPLVSTRSDAHVVVAEDIVPGEIGYGRRLDRVLVDIEPVRVEATSCVARIDSAISGM